ncbi:MAG: carbohydrate ABC transporter permease [Clostridia bacterium]|nr:carbohydrate ABC transporter permease [Clostridia bacterium]
MENVMEDQELKPEVPETTPTAPETEKKKSKIPTKLIWDIVVTVALSLGAVIMLLPFLWMVLGTFRTGASIETSFFPQAGDWSGKAYPDMWKESNKIMNSDWAVIRAILNSLLTTVPVVVVQILVSAFAAFAFAKLNFVGKNIMFLVLLSTMMVPFAVVMLPQVWWFDQLNLLEGPIAVIIPKFFGSITTVFFLRQFLYGIPDSISEAARLDGASYTRTFISVILPLLMPALATQAILSFIGNWNDFLGPLLYIQGNEWYTLPLLVNFVNNKGGSKGVLAVPQTLAISLISLVPIIIIFAVFQKKIIGSIVFSAVKG